MKSSCWLDSGGQDGFLRASFRRLCVFGQAVMEYRPTDQRESSQGNGEQLQRRVLEQLCRSSYSRRV